MIVRILAQPTATTELRAESGDAESARAMIGSQMPEGHELLRVHASMPRGGRVIAEGVSRATATVELEAEGPDYAAAKAAVLKLLPDDHRVLSYVTL